MNLTEGTKGTIYRVESIELETAIKRRLQMLGLTNGSQVVIVNRKASGSMILYIRGTRFALGNQFAKGIIVKEEAK